MSRITDLEKIICEAQTAYYNGAAILDDDEYDALVYELTILDSNNKILNKVGAEPSKEWSKEKHQFPLGSLNKVNYPSEIEKWIKEELNNHSVVVIEKMDGLSLGCRYKNGKLVSAILRGNGNEGENILLNVLKMNGVIKSLTSNFDGVIRGEIILTKSNHQNYLNNYKNPRNAASGICRELTGENCKYLSFIAYDVLTDEKLFDTEEDKLKFLQNNNFTTPNYKICITSQEVIDLWKEYQNKIRDSLDYEIDGLVVNCNDLVLQLSLGELNLRSKGKMAFKFANQFIKTTVKAFTFETGSMGRITPICWVEPVDLLGSRVEKASVYNEAYINQLGLDVGAEVLICKANEIIPRIEKLITSTGSVVKMPTNCNVCHTLAIRNGEYLECSNNNCPARVKGRLLNWIKELNLLEWGTGLIDRLVDSGKVNTIVDLYRLTIDDLIGLERMGKKSAEKCYKLLWEAKDVPLEVLLGGLSIPMIGQSTIKAIINVGCNTLEKFGQLGAAEFEQVPGIGPARAKSLADGLKNNQQLILDLLDCGVTIKEIKTNKLSGKSYCFTGTMINKRATLEKMAADAGAEVKDSVGKSLTFLVINDINSTSSKAVAARKFGTILISEDTFLDLVK